MGIPTRSTRKKWLPIAERSSMRTRILPASAQSILRNTSAATSCDTLLKTAAIRLRRSVPILQPRRQLPYVQEHRRFLGSKDCRGTSEDFWVLDRQGLQHCQESADPESTIKPAEHHPIQSELRWPSECRRVAGHRVRLKRLNFGRGHPGLSFDQVPS